MSAGRRVLILGGTSGIGLALALHFLNQGDQVTVCGRDPSRLPEGLREAHPALQAHAVDIADPIALARVFDEVHPGRLDLLIVTAGIYFNTRRHPLDEAATLRLLQTNVSGLSHAFELAARRMLCQSSGHLVALSSIAGLMKDYPGASVYSATKRSVLSLCSTYRLALAPFSIAVTAVVPGYMDTAKLRQLHGGDASHKPFLLSEAEAVARIVDAIDRRAAVCVFPRAMHVLVRALNCLPMWLLRGVLGRP